MAIFRQIMSSIVKSLTFLDTQEHLYACEKFQTPTVDISTFFVDCDDDNTKENVYINAKRLIDRLQEKQPK